MNKGPAWHAVTWVVLFSAGVATGWLLRERRAAEDARLNAAMRGLVRASQAQLTLAMIEQNRTAQLRPVLERELATDIRSAYDALTAHGAKHPAMPSLAETMRHAAEYLARQQAPKDVVQQAIAVSERLKSGS